MEGRQVAVDVVERANPHSVGDLEEHAAVGARPGSPHDGPQRLGHAPAAADHLAPILFGHIQPDDEVAVSYSSSSTVTASGSSTSCLAR